MNLSSLAPRKAVEPAQLNDEVATFWRRGFIVVRGVFAQPEMAVLKDIVTRHSAMQAHADRAKERSAGSTRPSFDTVFVWNDTARNDAFAKATRSRKIIERLEAIFGDEVYVYHNKVALKYPGVVGFSHHQDYWYWYQMGNLFPDMATAMIAVERHTKANGCLTLVEGSHKLGRLEHVYRDGVSDSGVDPERLEQILKVMPEVPIELEIGDVAIFHCNVLHASADNHSKESRIGLLGCYNTRHNDPYKSAHGHPGWHPQEKIDEPITEADRDNLPDFSYQWIPAR
ncbi:MAG: phytanoyl-CoA dioxygenase family protein [Burkholderiales bacterium]|nr:phytanoyl-CoA dioxygenase family protein [Burkholderiales bacterium]